MVATPSYPNKGKHYTLRPDLRAFAAADLFERT